MTDRPDEGGAMSGGQAERLGRTPSRRRAFSRLLGALRRKRHHAVYSVDLEGMPEVRLMRPISLREYIPWPWIYLPVVVKWFMLALRYGSLTLPTAVNPRIESGGFRGESKSSYLRQIGPGSRKWFARWTTVRVASLRTSAPRGDDLDRRMAEAGLAYPLIAKPDIGSCGHGVRLVSDAGELRAYLRSFPAGQTVILQEFLPWAGEAGIFYVRHPTERRGRIYSMGLRYYPHVVGDGRSTLRALIEADPRASRAAKLHLASFASRLDEVPAPGEIVRLAIAASLRVGALYRDGSAHITPTLVERVDEIARSMAEFYYGRFDVRFRTIEALRRGEDFRIVEINGSGAEAIHIWDPELTIVDAYRSLFEQHELLFDIAAHNRARGVSPLGLRGLMAVQWREARLLRLYPPSN